MFFFQRAIQLETEALANEDVEEEAENIETPVQWPPVPVIVSNTPMTSKGILLVQGARYVTKLRPVRFYCSFLVDRERVFSLLMV